MLVREGISLTRTLLVLQKVAGKDASKQFRKHHSVHILGRFKEDLHVGTLNRAQDEAPRKAMLFRFIRWK